jgi:hypothetical protein
MPKYIIWISSSAGALAVREVEVEAASEPAAYRAGKAECAEGEFVRGVFAVEEEA